MNYIIMHVSKWKKVLKEEFSNQYNSTNVEENKQQISQNLFSDSTKFL